MVKTDTPCQSVPVRCAPVAPPVDKFNEIASPVPNYNFPANKRTRFLPRSQRAFIPGDIWKK